MTRGSFAADETNNPEGISGPQKARACPKCGEEHKNLPLHIPACDGGS